MAKSKPTFTIESYGIYEGFNSNSKTLPKIKQVTRLIAAEVDVEFGFILRAKQAKGLTINWLIEHPNIRDKRGIPMAPFMGEEFIRNNDWQFYLGDTIWLPLEDKAGDWRLSISLGAELVAEKVLELTLDNLETREEGNFWKRRGF